MLRELVTARLEHQRRERERVVIPEKMVTITRDGRTRVQRVSDALDELKLFPRLRPGPPVRIEKVSTPFARMLRDYNEAKARASICVDLQDAWTKFVKDYGPWKLEGVMTFVNFMPPDAADKKFQAWFADTQQKVGALRMVRVTELQRREVIHYNVVVSDFPDAEFSQRNLERLWRRYGGRVEFKVIEHLTSLVRYMLKSVREEQLRDKRFVRRVEGPEVKFYGFKILPRIRVNVPIRRIIRGPEANSWWRL